MRVDMVEKILQGLLAIPDPPCLRCSWRRYCQVNEVACENFKAYINLGYRSSSSKNSRGMHGVNEPWPKHGPKPDLALGQNGL